MKKEEGHAMKHLNVLITMLLMVVAMVPIASGQDSYTLSGTVYDTSGARCPYAVVEYTIERTGEGGSVQADGNGNYAFDVSQLPSGYQFGDCCGIIAMDPGRGWNSYKIRTIIVNTGWGPARAQYIKPGIDPVVHNDGAVGETVTNTAMSVTVTERVPKFTKYFGDGFNITWPDPVSIYTVACWYSVDEFGTGLNRTYNWTMTWYFDEYLYAHGNPNVPLKQDHKSEERILLSDSFGHNHIWIDPACSIDLDSNYHGFRLDLVFHANVTGTNHHGGIVTGEDTARINDIAYFFI
jgi:hypothetical protein